MTQEDERNHEILFNAAINSFSVIACLVIGLTLLGFVLNAFHFIVFCFVEVLLFIGFVHNRIGDQ